MDTLTSKNIDVLTKNENFLKEHGEDIQAHIFSPHKKSHSLYLFLNFSTDPTQKEKIISFLNFLADKEKSVSITSVTDRDNFDPNPTNEPVFINLSLTAEGLEYFDCTGKKWYRIINHLRSKTEDLSNDEILNGQGKQNKVIHAMMLLAHEDEPELKDKYDFLKQYFEIYGISILKEERGRVYRKKVFTSQEKGFAVEHFGYADGLSNPWIRKKDTLLKNGTPKSNDKWNSVAPIDDFIISEPSDSCSTFGSYLVYRKFEQNVRKFKETIKSISEATAYEEDEIGSFLFGRTTKGVPVELLDRASSVSVEEYNNFNYQKNKCPFFAHIRQANPREQHKVKMIRCGATYGERKEINKGGNYELDDTTSPEKNIGLLFFSFVKNIDNFQNVLNICREKTSGVDPILGYIKTTDEVNTYTFKHKITKKEIPYEGMKGLVSLLEGINLYQPSINFFRRLPFLPNNNNFIKHITF